MNTIKLERYEFLTDLLSHIQFLTIESDDDLFDRDQLQIKIEKIAGKFDAVITYTEPQEVTGCGT